MRRRHSGNRLRERLKWVGYREKNKMTDNGLCYRRRTCRRQR